MLLWDIPLLHLTTAKRINLRKRLINKILVETYLGPFQTPGMGVFVNIVNS